jgi:tetratricopeptide (TPR) repeat protein
LRQTAVSRKRFEAHIEVGLVPLSSADSHFSIGAALHTSARPSRSIVISMATVAILCAGCQRQSNPTSASSRLSAESRPQRSEDEKAQQEINAARPYLLSGDAEEALKLFDQALAAHPNCARVYAARAEALGSLSRPAEAVASLSRALELDPQDDAYRLSRARALVAQGKLKEALEDCNALLKRADADATVYAVRADIHLLMERFDDALADANRCIELKPKSAEAYLVRGRVYLLQRSYRLAIADFDKAIKLNIDLADAYLNRALAHQAIRMNAEAISDFDAAVRRKPNNAIARYNRGMLLAKLGRYDEAIADFSSGIKTLSAGKSSDPSSAAMLASFYVKRAAAYGQQEKFQMAVDDCDAALRLVPQQPAAIRVRAAALHELEKQHSDERGSTRDGRR